QFFSLYKLVEAGQFEQALTMAAASGVDGIEMYEHYSVPAIVYRKAFNNTGIVCCGSHNRLGSLRDNLDHVMEYNYALGNRTIICHFLGQEERGTKDKWLYAAESFNNIAALLKRNGFDFLYHNHDFEFRESFDGVCGMDLIINNTDQHLVGFELHVSHLPKFNLDEAEYIKKLGRRIKFLHVSAFIASDPAQRYDSAPAINAARELDASWAVMENVYHLPVDYGALKKDVASIRAMAQG
ncbi:MAG: sugar phosphate isomerase/epimerase, partial [Oscillospiraceae bacterium]|nr:sugar phosphate isomerase/epimerase [Oscillospiraceae bacterium]